MPPAIWEGSGWRVPTKEKPQLLDMQCKHCGVYSNLDFYTINCPECNEAAMTVPIIDLLEAHHELLMALSKATTSLHEKIDKLELRLFPEEPIPVVKKGKFVN